MDTCARFVGNDKADIFDHIEIHDHLPAVVEKMMEFLKKHAMHSPDFSELRRKDIWSIPLTILREAMLTTPKSEHPFVWRSLMIVLRLKTREYYCLDLLLMICDKVFRKSVIGLLPGYSEN